MGLIMTATIAPVLPQTLEWLNVPPPLVLAVALRLETCSDALHHLSIGE
jgi:hypothetical protein